MSIISYKGKGKYEVGHKKAIQDTARENMDCSMFSSSRNYVDRSYHRAQSFQAGYRSPASDPPQPDCIQLMISIRAVGSARSIHLFQPRQQSECTSFQHLQQVKVSPAQPIPHQIWATAKCLNGSSFSNISLTNLHAHFSFHSSYGSFHPLSWDALVREAGKKAGDRNRDRIFCAFPCSSHVAANFNSPVPDTL